MTTANLIEIFCILDEFFKYFTPELKKHLVDTSAFYLGYVCQHMRKEFPHTVSYNRFVERQAQVSLHLLLFLQTCALFAFINMHGVVGEVTVAMNYAIQASLIILFIALGVAIPNVFFRRMIPA